MEHPSHRSFFDSSLELKCLFFFGLALAVVITISFWLYYQVTKSQLDTQNPLLGGLMVERQFLLTHMGVLLNNSTDSPDTESVDASADKVKELDTFIESMTLQSEHVAGAWDRRDFQRRLIRVQKHRPGADDQPRDEFERKLVKELLPIPQSDGKSTDTSQGIERIDDQGVYHYYMPLRMGRTCLICHNSDPSEGIKNEGTLLGIFQVTIPKPPARKELVRLWALLLGAAIVTAFLALIAFYAVIRFVIIRPLHNLREVSEAISRGDRSKRADLHTGTGDEFEALGLAFNEMLQHLAEVQDELQTKNIELERSVDELGGRNFQLEQINRVKSDFMATMSHELRTPLNSIIGFSEILVSLQQLDEKYRRYADNIRNSGNSLLKMINDILDMARLDAGRLEIHLTDFSIAELIVAQCDMARPLVEKKNLDLRYHVDSNLPMMRQDAGRIQQILVNLLANAIKFTPEGGVIRMEARRISHLPLNSRMVSISPAERTRPAETAPLIDCLEVKVVDSGVGISEEDQQIIFQKFRQGSSAKKEGSIVAREYEGSGLGLSIVKELCKLLEGEVSLVSHQGLGSTFTIILPWELAPPTRSESSLSNAIQQFSQTSNTSKSL